MSKLTVLTQNAKMKKSSSQGDTVLFNFGIPAFMSQDGTKTCPNAKSCVSGCYARSGTYRFKNTLAAYERRLEMAQSETFAIEMKAEVLTQYEKAAKKGKKCLIRIHDSGDFFSKHYDLELIKFIQSMFHYTDLNFYAYTKQVSLFKSIALSIPRNLTLIYSYGGFEDNLIDPKEDRHAKVFENETDIPASYIDASQDDKLALTQNKSIALVYHGNKNYANTKWSDVS